MSQKTTLIKGDLVKVTKSAELIKALEKDGWTQEGRKAVADSQPEVTTQKRGRKAVAE